MQIAKRQISVIFHFKYFTKVGIKNILLLYIRATLLQQQLIVVPRSLDYPFSVL